MNRTFYEIISVKLDGQLLTDVQWVADSFRGGGSTIDISLLDGRRFSRSGQSHLSSDGCVLSVGPVEVLMRKAS
jgi:hypothetical protein